MLNKVIAFSLKNRLMIVAMALISILYGTYLVAQINYLAYALKAVEHLGPLTRSNYSRISIKGFNHCSAPHLHLNFPRTRHTG